MDLLNEYKISKIIHTLFGLFKLINWKRLMEDPIKSAHLEVGLDATAATRIKNGGAHKTKKLNDK